MSERSAILDVRGLNVSFRSAGKLVPAVRNLSFRLNQGEILAIVGESGSGKSATAQAIMRLLPMPPAVVSGDHVLFEGQDLLTVSEKHMRDLRGNRISMIFQDPLSTLNPVIKVGDQIAEVFVRHSGLDWTAARARAIDMLDMVRIPEARRRADEYPHRFSGGMRQRVAIATAIATKPALLIADEPTTALDVTIQAQILELIRTLQREECMSVLFITHDMGVVAEMADRTVVMYNGDAVEENATAELFAAPKHNYTRALLSAVPRLGAMNGRQRPMRFPAIDPQTWATGEPQETPDTVDATAAPVLEVRNLAVRFDIRSGVLGGVTGRVHAVENVSFEIKPGETLALVGESGCGKSTTGRAITRLVSPNSGSILVDGTDIATLSGKSLLELRRKVQMIFQDPFASLDPRMSVGAAIAEPMIVHGTASRSETRARVQELLRQVGLKPEMASRLPHEFSGGQRQRVCIARALALNPSLIVADESVSALDVSIKAQVINLMLDLQARLGLSYIFISHDMAVVERVSHRVAVMYLGEIVEIGTREAVFGNPQHPYTRKLLSAVPVPDPALRNRSRVISNDELKSPIRAVDYVHEDPGYRTVGSGHLVLNWGPEWRAA
jgi:peptide/nickel transport system ATP-binding protein